MYTEITNDIQEKSIGKRTNDEEREREIHD
jgi:hypothetical protein